jgi:molybdopterin/thiamine biosynthesis adenylyltransferase
MITQEQSLRFKDALWFPKNNEQVIVGGSGGIGSWLALWLARAGFGVTLIDDDIVEERNMAGQFFSKSNIGTYKAEAVRASITEYCNVYINSIIQKINEDTNMYSPYMFSAFDNMEARKMFFNLWKKSITNLNHPIFIDGRLEMENLQIFCVTPENIERYENEYLFSDAEVENESCTARQTTHTAALISSLMVAYFTNHITNIYQEESVRDVPFFTEFFTPLNLKIDKNE